MSEWFAPRLLSAAPATDYWGTVGSTVVTGIVVVFLILAILVGFLSLMGVLLRKKKKDPAPAAPAPSVSAPVIREAAEETEEEDDGELIAVISAAVAAYGEAEGKQYRVVGVRQREKTLRSGWSAAGIAENTRGL
ncbi:MAG: OadG family protein [Eubacterium sp.]|nr:OadG family protein [Eubacterium sp.]MCM1417409.1 OadG family protein [Roseburia sp.]